MGEGCKKRLYLEKSWEKGWGFESTVLQFAFLGLQSFQYLRETLVCTCKISQATTCSYTVVGRGRRGKEKEVVEREETRSRSPQSPWGESDFEQ